MASTWTPELDALLLETIRQGEGYVAAAARVRRATRGRFAPHPTTCYRRVERLDELREEAERAAARRARRQASTRVDAPIPPRVRAPLAERLAPPHFHVATLPLDLCERHPDGVAGALDDSLASITAGWSYAVDHDLAPDAIACARHQATLRGEELIVVEEGGAGAPPIVALRRGARTLVAALVVVRLSRTA